MSAEAHAHGEESHAPTHATPKTAKPTTAADHASHAAKSTDSKSASHSTPTHNTAPATGERPITKAYNSIKEGINNSGSRIVETTNGFWKWVNKTLRAGDLEPVEEVSLVKTPFYAAGQLIDGTVLNAGRRAAEILEPSGSMLSSTFKTIGIPFSPIHSFMHPVETMKKPLGIGTASMLSCKNMIMAAPRALNEFADRAVARTVEQVNTKIGKIPLIGGLIAKPTNFVFRSIAKIIGTVKDGVDFITSPVDHLHNWATGSGSPATADTKSAPASKAHGHGSHH